MRLSLGKSNRRTVIAGIMLVAFLLRGLIPPGFMPASGQPLSLEICWEGLPAGMLAHNEPSRSEPMDMDMESMSMDSMPADSMALRATTPKVTHRANIAYSELPAVPGRPPTFRWRAISHLPLRFAPPPSRRWRSTSASFISPSPELPRVG